MPATYSWPTFQGDNRRSGVAACSIYPPLVKVWETALGGRIEGSPAVSNNLVFVSVTKTRGFNGSGCFCAVDAASGDLVWSKEVPGMVTDSPTVSGNIVLFPCWDGLLYALDTGSGREIWKIGAPSQSGARHEGCPLVIGGKVVVSGDSLSVIDLYSGRKIWERKNPEFSGSSPAAIEGKLYVGLYRQLVMLEKRLLWGYKCETWDAGYDRITAGPTLNGDLIVVGTNMSSVYALDRESGRIGWRFRMEGPNLGGRNNDWIDSCPVVANGYVYFGAPDGRIYALSIKGGWQLWSFNVGVPISGSPLVCGSVLYITSDDGTLLALELESGQKIWEFRSPSENVSASIAAVNGTIYVGWDKLYAFKESR